MALSGIMIVTKPRELRRAWRQQYGTLANQVFSLLPPGRGKLVEVGCGSGQLTIPLAKLAQNWRITCIDNFQGPYARDYKRIRTLLSTEKLERRVRIRTAHYSNWFASQTARGYRSIMSSEFLPELDPKETRRFLNECYRILRRQGVTVHTFLSPDARNSRQRLLIEADSDPRWTRTPPVEWFSPPSRFVLRGLSEAGFKTVRTMRRKSGLIIRGEAAKTLLRSWGVRPEFWQANRKRLESDGLEIPDWIILTGTKG